MPWGVAVRARETSANVISSHPATYCNALPPQINLCVQKPGEPLKMVTFHRNSGESLTFHKCSCAERYNSTHSGANLLLAPPPLEKIAPHRDREADLTPTSTGRGCVYLDLVKPNRGEGSWCSPMCAVSPRAPLESWQMRILGKILNVPRRACGSTQGHNLCRFSISPITGLNVCTTCKIGGKASIC